jgi:hypothetical protein
MNPPSEYNLYKELSRVTHVSETVLRKEVDLDLLNNYLLNDYLKMNTNPPPIQQEQTSYAAYILLDMRSLRRGEYVPWDCEDFINWKVQDFKNLPCTIR